MVNNNLKTILSRRNFISINLLLMNQIFSTIKITTIGEGFTDITEKINLFLQKNNFSIKRNRIRRVMKI